MLESVKEKLADLVLEFGINFQAGQKLALGGEPVHWDFINLLAKKAYERGAAFVHPELVSPMISIYRSQHQEEKYLDYVPDYKKAQIGQYVDECWSFVNVGGMEDPEIYQQMNQERNAIFQKAYREVSKPLSKQIGSGKSAWTVVALPTQKWAEQVTGLEGEEALSAMWEDMITILRLNSSDPVATWREHSNKLKERCQKLNSLDLEKIVFSGEGTDLTTYFTPKSRWVGGAIGGPVGEFFPNLPSEEVFTTPDFQRTDGRVRITRPVNVLGEQVEGAWFEFKQGEVVEYGAEKGRELLENYFKIDPQAKFLGEVALVDGSSPIFKSNRIFYNILFDENAACHIALGRGIDMAIEGGDQMNEEELKEVGCNQSLLHTDFMIGYEGIEVMGTTRSGEQVPIMKEGTFVL